MNDTMDLDEENTERKQDFEPPAFMSEWTDKEKAELAFQLLTTLPPNEVVKIVDRISPYLHCDILSQFPCEIAIYILSFLDMPSLIQASEVSRGWHMLCEEQSLWRNLFEAQGWGYDRKAMDNYLANVPEEEYHHTNSSNSNSNAGNNSSSGESGGKIQPLPIARTSSPLMGRSKWSRLYALNRNNKNASPSVTRQQHQRNTMDHYDPYTDTRFINWKTLYQNRFAIESRWQGGSCMTRMFPPDHVPQADLHREGIYCIQFDKDKIVTGSRDRTVKVWDIKSGRCRLTMRGHTASVLCLQYDEDSVVSGSSDSNLLVTNLETGEIQQTLEGHQDSVLSLRLVKDDQIISCSKDRSLRLWNKHSGECIRIFLGHRAAVNAVQWKDHRIVSASGDRTVKVWDLDNGKCLNTLIGHTRGVACVEFDGKYIVSGSSDQTIKVWNAETGESIFTLFGHTVLVRTIQLDPIAKRIISGCYNGHLKIWSLDKGSLIRDLGQATEGRILNLKFDCTKILCCSNAMRIAIYDFAHGLNTKFLL